MTCSCNTKPNCGCNEKVDHCPANTVTHIGQSKDKLIVTMNDCIQYMVNPKVLDQLSVKNNIDILINVEVENDYLKFTVHDLDTGKNDVLKVYPPKAANALYGTVRYATDLEAIDKAVVDAVLTPSSAYKLIERELKNTDNLPKATQSDLGIVKLATALEATDTKNNTAVLTPYLADLLIKAVLENVLKSKTASETELGLVKKGTEIVDLAGNSLGFLVQ